MRRSRDRCAALTATAIVLAASVVIAEQSRTSGGVAVAFSDRSRPGTLAVQVVHGSIVVRGTDRADVRIEAAPHDAGRLRPRWSDGAAPSGAAAPPAFTTRQDDNVISIVVSNPGKPLDFEIEVPSRTNLRLATVNVGDVVVDAVEGELEVSNVNGAIRLTKIGGSIVASSVNGEVRASLTSVAAEKAMAFTSLHGIVDVTLPATVRANLKLRSDAGDVFSDFDLGTAPPRGLPADASRSKGPLGANKLVYASVNGGGPELEMRSFDGNVYVRKGR
jgi:hypothetical protein